MNGEGRGARATRHQRSDTQQPPPPPPPSLPADRPREERPTNTRPMDTNLLGDGEPLAVSSAATPNGLRQQERPAGGGASPAASAMRRRIEQRECETAGSHPVSCLAQRLRSVPHPSPQASWLWRLRCRQRRLVHAAPGLSERRRRRQVPACAWAWAWAREGGGSRHLKPRSAASIKQGRRLQLGWRHPARRQRRRRSGRRRGHSRGISSGEATRVQAVASRQPENSRCLNHRKYY
jgi:hypothetical protein